MKKAYLIIPVVALATLALLPLNRVVAPMLPLSVSENPAVNRMFVAQLLTLALTGLVLLFVGAVHRQGTGAASASPVPGMSMAMVSLI